MQKLESQVIHLVRNALGPEAVPEMSATPHWLMRPGETECRNSWFLVKDIYAQLTGLELPPVMRPVERRTVDAVINPDGVYGILEIDEKQHFNQFRASTIRSYPEDLDLGFDREKWIERSEAKKKLEGGGFAVSKPPLFPGSNGRHRQRAFRDALSDILPREYGFGPTVRIAYFEVRSWVSEPSALGRIQELLVSKLRR